MRAAAGVALAVVVAAACSREELSAATREAEPHVADFVRFESWVRRTVSAHAELRERAALQEVLFAPLVLEREVRGARVVAEQEHLFRDGVGPTRSWRVVRAGGEEVEVASGLGSVALGRTRSLGGMAVRVEVAFEAARP